MAHPNEKVHAAVPIKIGSIVLGKSAKVNSPTIYVPISFFVRKKGEYSMSFIQKNIAFIGMDILRNFNFGVNFDNVGNALFNLELPLCKISPRNKKAMKIKFID